MTLPRPDQAGHTGVGARIGYSLGNLGKSIVLTMFDTFLLYYLVRIAGFSPVGAGALLTAVMLWDGFADTGFAYLADRHGKSGALGRLVLIGAPVCAMGFWLIFAIPPAGGHAMIAAAVLLCRTGYTLCDIGHNTLLVRIAATPRDAASVSGMRLIFSAMGAGLVGLVTGAILSLPLPDQQTAFMRAAMIGGLCYGGTLLIAIGVTRNLPRPDAARVPTNVAALFGGLWRNHGYRQVLCLIALQAGLVSLFGRALPFLSEATHGDAGRAGTALAIITLCQALSLPLWMLLSRRRSPKTLLILAHGIMLAALGLLAFRSGGPTELTGLALLGVAQAGMNMAIWAMLALAIRRGAAHGAMNEALPIGLFLTVLKAGAGIGNGFLTAAIALGNRVPMPGTNGQASAVYIVALLLPMLGCLAALALVTRQRRGTSAWPLPKGDPVGLTDIADARASAVAQ